jgi:phosphate-selective porin OprO/OprP
MKSDPSKTVALKLDQTPKKLGSWAGLWAMLMLVCLALASMAVSTPAWALNADELLDLMVDEGAITPEKAQKIKEKARKIDKAKQAQEDAKRAQELQQVKQEAKAEAKVEAVKEAKAEVKKAVPKPGWKAYWDNGLKVESEDGKNKVKVGGRIQYDVASVSSPTRRFADQVSFDEGTRLTGSGAEFRRARLYIEGDVYEDIFFKAQYDFAGGSTAFKDVYLGVKKIPYIGHIRVGQMKEPWSIEEQTSSNFITFMERALPNVFSQERKPGGMVYNTAFNKRVYWGAGVFFNTIRATGDTDAGGDSYQNFQNWDLTARLAGTPLYEDNGRRLIHLGFSYMHQFRNDSTNTNNSGTPTSFALRYRQRPEAHITDARTVDTGGNTNARTLFAPGRILPVVGQRALIATEGVNLINPEFALVWGPFSLQGEYVLSAVEASRRLARPVRNTFLTSDNPTFQGGYAYVSYFLTGEHRTYKQSDACFDRIKPKRNFNLKGTGWGAWEVAFRWSYLNLNSSGVYGGIENDYTIGLNWYLTPNTRWMFNYVQADITDRQVTPSTQYPVPTRAYPENYANGSVNVVETRFQIDF